MKPLIRDLIDIPQRVQPSDFVVNLGEARAARETLRDYVVTDQLASCFNRSLGMIGDALGAGKSHGAYLHGSFGSGKSHFMSVLDLILQNHEAVHALAALHGALAPHKDWLQEAKLLMVPVHMLGANCMEAPIYEAYLNQCTRLDPDVERPAVFRSDAMFEDLLEHRAALGDEAFFARLNKVAGGNEVSRGRSLVPKGQPRVRWSAATFEEALGQTHGTPARDELASHAVRAFFRGYARVMSNSEQAYIPLDEGLAALSRHAHKLRFRGVILFLDEFILWLTSRYRDSDFVSREVGKISKLLEYTHDRPVPIISFLARQRSLKDMLGGGYRLGAEQEALMAQLDHWSGRFKVITLEDRNLPAIAEHRVLRPRSNAALQSLREAWKSLNPSEEEKRLLLGEAASQEDFARIYPFSPALLQALVGLSSVLQRNRTAIKVMFQMLVNARERLRLGELVPMGELYDAIEEEADPFDAGMSQLYENARRLFRHRLLPLLCKEHGLSEEEARDVDAGPFYSDCLLAKTLVLAALAPELSCFREMTGKKLATLNYARIKTPIPGQEGAQALNKVRGWAAVIGEIRIGEGKNPFLSLHLTGVDTEVIIESARGFDRAGARQGLIKRLLFDEMEVADNLAAQREVIWRGSKRHFNILSDNVRKLPQSSFRDESSWLLIVDYPFDEPGHGPDEDLVRFREVKEQFKGKQVNTVIWLPRFFSEEAMAELGRLVILEKLLLGEQLRNHTGHLNESEREVARNLLLNLREQLKNRLLLAVRAAYGIAADHNVKNMLQEVLPQQICCFRDEIELAVPKGANLCQAFEDLADQILSAEFPDHPHFGCEVRTGDLRKLWGHVRDAAANEFGRTHLTRKDAELVMAIAVPLRLANWDGERYMKLDPFWVDHLERFIARRGTESSVKDLREAFDEGGSRGLAREIQDLLIFHFTAVTNRGFSGSGAPSQFDMQQLSALRDEVRLFQERLPTQEQWARARDLIGALFNLSLSPMCGAAECGLAFEEVRKRLADQLSVWKAGLQQLCEYAHHEGLDECTRIRVVNALDNLLTRLGEAADGHNLIVALADYEPVVSIAADARDFVMIAKNQKALAETNWQLLDTAGQLPGDSGVWAFEMRSKLEEAFAAVEFDRPLASALEQAEKKATELVALGIKARNEPVVARPDRPLQTERGETRQPEATRKAVKATVPVVHVTQPKPKPSVRPVVHVQPESVDPKISPLTGTQDNLSKDALLDLVRDIDDETPAGLHARFSLTWVFEASP